MWFVIIILIVAAIILGIYFMNIGLIRTQLEELSHRHNRGDSLSGDLEEWEYYMKKLFLKPFGTKKTILTYGPHFEDYVQTNHPEHKSDVFSKYKRLRKKLTK